jgi:hypothetical protein
MLRVGHNPQEQVGLAEAQPNLAPTVKASELESPTNTCKFCPLTPERFHVLFNSLFKVLFNFPSRYLFAIGLVVIFSLRWSLPPDLGCTPKQPDSTDKTHCVPMLSYGPGTLYGQWPRSRGTWITIKHRESFVPNATFHDTRGMPDSALDFFLFARRY